MNEMKIKVKGMTCGGCADGVKVALSGVEGVSEIDNSNWQTGDIVLKSSSEINIDGIKAALDNTPYQLEPS